MEGPLDGIRVLEVANWLAAPSSAAILADMGADVVKVEPPAGDAWRGFQLASYAGYDYDFACNYGFVLDNRGKRSVSLNLESAEGRSVVHRLLEDADVFVTNLTPTRLDRFGLAYSSLADRYPRLIAAYLTGYGPEGPDRERLGFDYTAFWARSGIMSLVGEEGRRAPMPRSGMGDHSTSPMIACAILAALYERQRTDYGQAIQLSLYHAGLWVLGLDVQAALVSGRNSIKADPEAPRNPISNAYLCRDGTWLMLWMPQADTYWPKVCAAVGRPELAEEQRFSSIKARAENSRELVEMLKSAFASADSSEWGRRLDEQGLIWAPVQTVADVVDDPQVRANGWFTTIDDPNLGSFETIEAPFRFSGSHVGVRGPAPEAGQHTEEVLLEAGYTWEEIAVLREAGAL